MNFTHHLNFNDICFCVIAQGLPLLFAELAQRKLHSSGCWCVCLSMGFHSQRLLTTLGVREASPVTHDSTGVLRTLKTVAVIVRGKAVAGEIQSPH